MTGDEVEEKTDLEDVECGAKVSPFKAPRGRLLLAGNIVGEAGGCGAPVEDGLHALQYTGSSYHGDRIVEVRTVCESWRLYSPKRA